MRTAIISDIHGNVLAFEAVLADLSGDSIDGMVCLGDAVQGGAQPAAVVARLRELAPTTVIGNADAWLLTGIETGAEGPPSSYQLAVREWSLAQLSEDDRRYIGGFQPTIEIDLPASKTLLCTHGSPRSFDDVILPETPDAEVRAFLGQIGNTIVCGGHTHLQQIRQLGQTFFFNPGSVSLPFRRDTLETAPVVNPWAEYAVLTVDDSGSEQLGTVVSWPLSDRCAHRFRDRRS